MNTITLMNLKVFVGLTAVLFGFSGAAGMYVTSFGVIDGNTYVNSPTFYPDDGRLYLDEQDAAGSLEIEGGEKARFDSDDDGVQVLEVYQHHLSDYLRNAKRHGFTITEIEEWFDHDAQVNIPRLITFIFKKP